MSKIKGALCLTLYDSVVWLVRWIHVLAVCGRCVMPQSGLNRDNGTGYELVIVYTGCPTNNRERSFSWILSLQSCAKLRKKIMGSIYREDRDHSCQQSCRKLFERRAGKSQKLWRKV